MFKTFLVATLFFLTSSVASFADDAPLKRVLNPGHLFDTTQYGYSQAVVVSPKAETVYVAGQIGIAEDGPNTFEHQVDRAFGNMLAVLRAAGAGAADVAKITLFIKNHDADKLSYIIKKRREVFGKSPPASTLIPVPVLALESLEFEIDAIAVVPAKPAR